MRRDGFAVTATDGEYDDEVAQMRMLRSSSGNGGRGPDASTDFPFSRVDFYVVQSGPFERVDFWITD